ncbi:MAG: hypothetical protein ACQEVT_13200 [Pseudomonadota bacterium]|uniref:hypothetical protein n=1 Tax=Roseovarius TaxID=74030 RepID=UPI0022A8A3AA|nr:hypothetical protein [Roseovarius sp. EGI FJ00037]MCZ0814174.1 hypothetical protein [Roseovarius sp. EGI FJ00037]
MYGPQNDLNRGTTPDPYSQPNPIGSRSSRGSVIALFVIIALIAGLILLGSMGDGPATTGAGSEATTGTGQTTGETAGGTATGTAQ